MTSAIPTFKGSKLDQANLEKFMLASGVFTYRGLCKRFSAIGTRAMQIDRTIQKLRRQGLIFKTRKGHEVFWQNSERKPADTTALANLYVSPSDARLPQQADASLS